METINKIECPYCKTLIEPWEYIDTGDMEGEFKMPCEKCNRKFNVSFETEIKFKTSIEEKEGKPICFLPNDDVYPLCVGEKNDGKLVKVCEKCNLYEDMKEGEY